MAARFCLASIAFVLAMLVSPGIGVAELDCYAKNIGPQPSAIREKFYETSVADWQKLTRTRYLEGSDEKACKLREIAGYEGFPTRECNYQSADAGAKHFYAIKARVVVLDPSAAQLANWSIHACRSNGATDATMAKCLDRLKAHIVASNGAQFPVAGSVVESICNSGGKIECGKLPLDHKDRAPRNTIFRDGIAIYVTAITRWKPLEPLLPDVYDRLFDVQKADSAITFWGSLSRISGATRENWVKWRKHIGKSVSLSEGADPDLSAGGWQLVSREVHKAACRGNSNDLFDSIVYSNKWGKS